MHINRDLRIHYRNPLLAQRVAMSSFSLSIPPLFFVKLEIEQMKYLKKTLGLCLFLDAQITI